eukprot:249402_1
MAFGLSSVFEVPKDTMVVGYVTPIPTGCVINIQHLVFKNDMQALREILLKNISKDGFHGFDVHVTPQLFLRKRYHAKRRQAADALSLHFFAKKDASFSIEYHRTFEEASDTAVATSPMDGGDSGTGDKDTDEEHKTDDVDRPTKALRDGLENQMALQIHSQTTTINDNDLITEMFKSMQEMQSAQMKSIQEIQSTQQEMQLTQQDMRHKIDELEKL